MSRDKSVTKMDTMPIGRLVMSMSWPAMLSMVIQACYNVVDTYFVSMIGEKSLTAITLIFPIQMLMIAVSVGTGIGINSLIARRLGARRYADADRAASQGLKLYYINWLIFVVVGVFFARPFVAAFTEDADIIAQGAKYLLIVCVGCLFVMIQVSCEKILQATGNMVLPMLTNMIGAVTNTSYRSSLKSVMALSSAFTAACPDSSVGTPMSTFTSSSTAARRLMRPSSASSAFWMMENCAGRFMALR